MVEEVKTKPIVKKTGRIFGVLSALLAVIYAVFVFAILDESVVKAMLVQSGIEPTSNIIGAILNNIRFTGILYIIAYISGVVAIWNQHPYLWWFIFTVFISNVMYNAINVASIVKAIATEKGAVATIPLLIVVVVSLVAAVYMLVVSIRRKTTFNR